MGDTYSDLLIRIGPQDNTTGAYSVEAQLDDGASWEFSGELRLDHDRLTATRSDPVEYGFALFDTLFTGTVRRVYDEAFTGSLAKRAEARESGFGSTMRPASCMPWPGRACITCARASRRLSFCRV